MTARAAVVVVGAGVIGLSTAVVLAEAGHRVLVYTAEPPEETTSAAAGALWGPWLVEPRVRVLPWAARTLAVLRQLAHLPRAGVAVATGTEISTMEYPPPDWADLLVDRSSCRPSELPRGYRYGTRFSAPLVDMPTYLDYLADRLDALGGAVRVHRFDDLAEVANSGPIVVNCTGIGARSLVGDDSLYPVQGQQLVVTNPGLTEFIEVDTGESEDLIGIYPHRGCVVLGGTAMANRWDRTPDPVVAAAIHARCAAIEPRLRSSRFLAHRVGLRPSRPTVRVEQEEVNGRMIVHNYGHGGAGVSIAWGCAEEVAQLVTRAQD